jgi:hypothetical protein
MNRHPSLFIQFQLIVFINPSYEYTNNSSIPTNKFQDHFHILSIPFTRELIQFMQLSNQLTKPPLKFLVQEH